MADRQHPNELDISNMERRDPRNLGKELKQVREHPLKEEPQAQNKKT